MNFQNLQSLNQIIPDEETQGEEMYKTWKKNVPLLYDTMITHIMDWPSLTTQFLPINLADSDGLFTTYKMVLGTHTTNNMPNYLMIAKVRCGEIRDIWDKGYLGYGENGTRGGRGLVE